jgi:hypothetical protein
MILNRFTLLRKLTCRSHRFCLRSQTVSDYALVVES